MDKSGKPPIKEELRKYLAEIGRKGGIKASKNMTRNERVKRAQKAVKARWERARKEQSQ